ncbi:MAG: hypothetical protein PHV02_11005 [Rhodocyclaceae bacterium]|nr:hypothetical protein [Rhodocyclaceae bacterium]
MLNLPNDLFSADNPALFPLGQVVATPGALALLEEHQMDPFTILNRHVHGDWGDALPFEDVEANNAALIQGERLLSAYRLGKDKLYVISEWDRSVTTLLMPSEY